MTRMVTVTLAIALVAGIAPAYAKGKPTTTTKVHAKAPKTPTKVHGKSAAPGQVKHGTTPSTTKLAKADAKAARAAARAEAKVARADAKAAKTAAKGKDADATTTSNVPKNPKQQERLQAMLPDGMTLEEAADGFKNKGQFVAALHVSENLDIPFVDLKTQMVDEGTSLGQAIQTLKPGADAEVETQRAQGQADQDLQ